MDEILMTPDVCMKFLVWSYYYHDIVPEPTVSYASCGRFSDKDSEKLDMLKETLFRCFTVESVNNAIGQFRMAKINNEPCPFTLAELDMMFASPLK